MTNIIDAKLLAQVATDQLEDNEVVTLLNDICTEMPSELPENRDYDRLYVANRLCKANKTLVEKYRRIVLDLMRSSNKGHTSVTRNIDGHLFKLYYLISYTWQNLRLKEKPEEEMTEEDKAIKQAHDKYVSLFDEIEAMETKLHIYKQDMKTTGDILASLLPKSDCIKYSPVLQIA